MTRSSDLVMVEREPTEAMLNAARDWSIAKYGIGIGNDAAVGCWRAMIAAALQSVEGGVQVAAKQESCPESAPRTEMATFLQRASDILEKHLDRDGGDIYIGHLGSRRAISIITAYADEMASIAAQSAKIIALADAIRSAQRAYMADRGNQERGKAVAAAAEAYDASRMKSAPLLLAPHNSGERDPSVMPDSGGADTKSDGGAASHRASVEIALQDARASFQRIIDNRDNKNWRKPELIQEAERGLKSCSR